MMTLRAAKAWAKGRPWTVPWEQDPIAQEVLRLHGPLTVEQLSRLLGYGEQYIYRTSSDAVKRLAEEDFEGKELLRSLYCDG